eukprot:gb/GEZN01004586.1/.p1 GENE.gb/GEZN01004586.1/~~gb/GEZN01004586.1/.p1  ORF type:complete len:442 (-),score=28.01 gb/GEZN01004586.1/:551-1876(-)
MYDEESSLLQVDPSSKGGEEKPRARLSLLRLFAINSCVFAYGLIVATMGLIVLPIESTRLFPKHHALMMGFMLAITGISQLICPIAGYLSDRTVSSLGRRRPYILAGTIMGVMGLYAMFLCRQLMWGPFYVVTLFFAVLGLNMMYSGYTALVPDLVPKSQNGLASGIMGVMGMMGSCFGFFTFGFVLDSVWAYLVYAVTISGACVLTCICAQEKALPDARPIIFREIYLSFTIDRTTHEDFYWVFVIRTLYYMAVAIQAFILFYLRDVVHADRPAYHTALLAMYGQLAATVVAVPAGSLSQHTGRKIMIVVGCISMSIVYAAFILIDQLEIVLLMGFVYGMGNGVFLSVDYALALDTLPVDGENNARDLGMWGVAAFLGSTLGGAIGGVLLNFIGAPPSSVSSLVVGEPFYMYRGYLALLLSGICYLALAVALLPRIKSAR